MNQFVLDSLSSSNIIIHSLEIWRFTLFARLMVFFFVSMVKQCTKRIHLKFKGYCLPADHPSTCWRILKNSAICAANFVLYHETAGMYPIVFGTYYIQSLVIHRLVTPVNERKEKKPWIFYRRIHCVKVQLKFLTNE